MGESERLAILEIAVIDDFETVCIGDLAVDLAYRSAQGETMNVTGGL